MNPSARPSAVADAAADLHRLARLLAAPREPAQSPPPRAVPPADLRPPRTIEPAPRPLRFAPAAPPLAPPRRRWRRALAGNLPVLLLATIALLQAWNIWHPPSIACSADSTTCFDSGWQPVSNHASTAYFFRHRLGAPPRQLTLWFSPTADGARAFPLQWRFPTPEAGNPVTIEARARAIYVNVWKGMPISGSYDGPTEQWTTYDKGFYRVVAMR
jgi:hypothetical protein